MKKRLFYIFCLLFLIPVINVKAASITGVNVSGTNSATVGEEFSLYFNVSYSGVDKGSSNTMGVGGVFFELLFDDSVFSVINASSNGFDTEWGESDGQYYVISTINANASSNKCLDGVLYCNNYTAIVTFYVKDTNKTNSNISIRDGSAVLFKVGSNYGEEDPAIITNPAESTHVVNITKTNSVPVTEPKSIVSNVNPNNIVSKAESKVSKSKQNITTNSKSENKTTTKPVSKSNNDLKSLKIKNHKINFDKEKLDYKIFVKESENILNIEALPEDDKSTVVITGADDLKKNNYKVLVEVAAQDGTKKTYTINAEQSNNKNEDKKENKKPSIKLSKNTIKIISVSLGTILITVIVLLIIKHKSNKKLDKMLDEFDKL